jgi:hypothetical protein
MGKGNDGSDGNGGTYNNTHPDKDGTRSPLFCWCNHGASRP